MFGRRVFASAAIPRAQWASLHIMSAQQAARRLPSLIPLNTGVARSVESSLLLTNGGGLTGTSAISEKLNDLFSKGAIEMSQLLAIIRGEMVLKAFSWHTPLNIVAELSRRPNEKKINK
ncbi:hypothetical protein AGDE_13982 [Angomonas deanei]|uniref:Uncharacterized protein n=1 Tax=Angomonas deanei TaxID=59799 RepID=A0A7G2CHC6_9TRYP|nr:hypothetical protein AGDE_13982 [Angomonas deanei]CAD2217612.1 hypothetical protein, conserved [Angomonas deanei]|eukprot:EPY21579.1 hypothetical protein AGDE_13982 [Angomonas deanei]